MRIVIGTTGGVCLRCVDEFPTTSGLEVKAEHNEGKGEYYSTILECNNCGTKVEIFTECTIQEADKCTEGGDKG